MEPFPDEWELLALFESEPTIEDRGVPWFYNRLIFETTRNADHIRCEIEPAYDTLKLYWWHERKERISLELTWVLALRVVTGGGIDYLVASFRDSYLQDLEFHIKPEIRLRWATSAKYPPG